MSAIQPVPASTGSTRAIRCPIQKRDISRGECQELCSDPQTNINLCTKTFGCTNGSRICWACLPYDLRSLVGDPKEGLCVFHLRNGVDARPPHAKTPVLIPIAAKVAEMAPVPAQEEALAAVGLARKKPRLEMIPKHLISPMKGQPRQYFDAELLGFLKSSLDEFGQQQAVSVTPDPNEVGRYILIDGERRWRSCKDDEELLCVIRGEEISDDKRFLLSVIANLHQASHTPLEKANAMKRLREGELKLTIQQLTYVFGCSKSSVGNHLAILEGLCPPVLELLDPRKHKRPLGFVIATELTAFAEHPEEQLQLAKEIMERKLTLHEARRLMSKKAKKLEVKTGRGREKTGWDYLANLKSTMAKVEMHTEPLLAMREKAFGEMFAGVSAAEKAAIAKELADRAQDLHDLAEEFTMLSKSN